MLGVSVFQGLCLTEENGRVWWYGRGRSTGTGGLQQEHGLVWLSANNSLWSGGLPEENSLGLMVSLRIR